MAPRVGEDKSWDLGTLELLIDGGYRMSPTAHALLWFFLCNLMRDPNGEWFRHVNIYKTPSWVLEAATGRTPNAVRTGLVELESLGFIKRTPRVREDGSDSNPDIELTTPADFCFTCRVRGHANGSCAPRPLKNRGGAPKN